LQRLKAKESPQIGLIKPEDPSYEGYHEILSTITAEEFETSILPQNATERRRGLTLINSILPLFFPLSHGTSSGLDPMIARWSANKNIFDPLPSA
jgi:hypothetical protein